MIEKLKPVGWLIAVGLLALLLVQRSCIKNRAECEVPIHDTILIKGDTQLYTVQDTVLEPYKVYYRDSIPKIDTAGVIKDYFASRVYNDTIRARDVTAVIEDSISANKIAGHKVLIENSRDLQLATLETRPSNKIFIGCFLGYSTKDLLPVAGVSFSLITRKYVLSCFRHFFGYNYL